MSWLGRAARSRLVQFALVGGALWAVASSREDRRDVEIDPTVLAALHDAQAKKLGVADLPAEGRREVDARAIEDEILYREALRLGLDQDDPIVKQRLVQKLLLLVEDVGGASREPSRAELRAYWERTRERWRRPTRYTIVQVFAARRDALPPPEALDSATEPPPAGDALPYPRKSTSSRADMERLFGAGVAEGVARLRPGEISDPLRSSYGWHRVRLVGREDGGPASFDEVEKDVTLEYLLERREEVVGAYLKRTVASYRVRIGGEELRGFVPTRRVAARTEGSAED